MPLPGAGPRPGPAFASAAVVRLESPEVRPFDHAEAAQAWLRHMRRGDWTRAWGVSDAIRRASRPGPRAGVPRHEQHIWDGTSLDGRRVLVRCYHGLGDTIQFIRYAPLVRERAAGLAVWAQPALLPLLATVNGIDRLLPLHDGEVDVPYDVDVEIMELPWVFRTTAGTVPDRVPYLQVSPARLPHSDHPRVGIAWRAGDWAPHRSVPFDLVRPLLSAPVSWYVLQGRPGLAECPAGPGIVAGTDDIVELAQVMASLDLVITVDSMTAHLAGALGRPVWTLLAADADWRWMEDRNDSPWYPTMRLFRQERAGEWEPVIERVREELGQGLGTRDKG